VNVLLVLEPCHHFDHPLFGRRIWHVGTIVRAIHNYRREKKEAHTQSDGVAWHGMKNERNTQNGAAKGDLPISSTLSPMVSVKTTTS
jgi:hypothetical protein